ncbi:similar to WD repeat domain phosphoinositide-interacting protein 3 [Botrytis cinerea T4]|uniref:Similar to WD repeat domain phosphoinositide-interacting protein 3 n=1 Tax=Botryotinia fuckeliana (strain T4) TaxID=999810 RepID=G2YQP3_BOTF4|nr:similar to WD repeat domain phosphoinositide-interacting protein 3 [Botrytis cinerea T4]
MLAVLLLDSIQDSVCSTPKHANNELPEVIIWDDLKAKVAAQVSVLTSVRGVRITRTHIVVALLNSIRVYHFQSNPTLYQAYETASNPNGLCCLSASILIFPGRTAGQVQVVELNSGNVSIIPAHTGALRALALSRDDEIIATASETGTLVRVFATSNCAKIAELRRGVDHADIFSISISPSGQLLAVTSDKATLHVFDIPHPSKPPRSESATGHRRLTSLGGGGSPTTPDSDARNKWGILGKLPLMPRLFSDIYSFATATFSIGEEPLSTSSNPLTASDAGPKASKGVIGWTSDESLIVVGAGTDSRWEKFIIAEGEDGKRYCIRDGWKRIMRVE